jgi:hypothetical protein
MPDGLPGSAMIDPTRTNVVVRLISSRIVRVEAMGVPTPSRDGCPGHSCPPSLQPPRLAQDYHDQPLSPPD